MIGPDEAREIADLFLSEHLRPVIDDVVFVEDHIGLESVGWVFPYQSRGFLEGTGSPLAGNLPIVVDPVDGSARYMTLDEATQPRSTT